MKEADPEGPEKGILGRSHFSSPRLWGGWVRYWRDEWDVSGALVLRLPPLHSADVSIYTDTEYTVTSKTRVFLNYHGLLVIFGLNLAVLGHIESS